MTRIAPYAQQQLIMSYALQTQERMYDAQVQIATGQKSQLYSGIAPDTSRLLSMEANLTRTNQYILNIEAVERRLEIADISLAGIEDIARELQDILDTAVDAPSFNHSQVRQYATNAKALLTELLNAKDADRFIFSGQRIDQPAVDTVSASYTPVGLIEADATTVNDTFYADYRANVLGTPGYPQGSFYEQIYFDKNGVAPTAPLPVDLNNPTLDEFVGEDPDLWTYYVSRLSSPQMMANPKLDYYGGNDTATSVQIAQTTSVNYGINAGEPSIQQLVIALDTLANLPETASDDAFLGPVYEQVKEMLEPILTADPTTPLKTVGELRIESIGPINLLQDTRERHVEYTNYAQNIIADIEQVDEVEAIARLQADQVVLEASFTALSRVQSLSLVNFLS